jgi:hypothetical protein
MSTHAEMELIMEDFMGDISFVNEDENNIETNKEKSYYIGKGIFILNQLQEDTDNFNDNYFNFLSSILKDFKGLSFDKQQSLKEIMCIEDKIKIVEKRVIIQEKKKDKKPKINNYDDY